MGFSELHHHAALLDALCAWWDSGVAAQSGDHGKLDLKYTQSSFQVFMCTQATNFSIYVHTKQQSFEYFS